MKSRKQTDRAFILGRMKLLSPVADLDPDILGKLLENAQVTNYPRGLHFLIPADQGSEYV